MILIETILKIIIIVAVAIGLTACLNIIAAVYAIGQVVN